MSYLIIEDFRRGLDPRKFKLGAPAGTLVDFVNGHITNAGDIEKRKAFVAFSNLAINDDNGDQGIFGLQETATGLTVFGHAGLNGTAPTLSQPELAADIPVTSPVVTYQKLTHPAILEGETYDRTKHRMTKLVASELYGGNIEAVALFADGKRFGYSNGVFVQDYAAGLVLAHLVGDNTKQATHLTRLLNLSDGYTAAQTTLTTTNRARAGNVATLTVTPNPSTAGLVIGSKVRVAGVGGAGYNSSLVTLTGVTSSTITYANVGGNEGSTPDLGGTITTALITATAKSVGVEFDVDITKESAAGTITGPTNTVAAVKAVTGAEARGSFTITGGSANGVTPTAATGTITRTATNAADGEYVQIGKKKYTFRAVPAVEGDVDIGASAADSLTNLQRAITHTGTPGTHYVCAWAHPWIRTAVIAGSVLTLTAYKGSQGDSIALVLSMADWTGSAATLGASAGNCIGSVKVVAPNGTETELLSDAVQFTEDASTTAASVRNNIVAFTGTSGYTATVNENTVTILSSSAASPMPNGYHVQVAGGGDVLVGECLFYLTQQQPGFTINTILVDGLDLLSGTSGSGSPGAKLFPVPPVDTLPEYYALLVATINTFSGATGINAWTNGEYLKLSRISTRDDDQPLTVYVTPLTANTVGVVFGKPPDLALPLTVTLPENVGTVGTNAVFGISSGNYTGLPSPMSSTLIAEVKGGNGLYTYEWLAEYPGTATGSLGGSATRLGNPFGNVFTVDYAITVSPGNARGAVVLFTFTALNGTTSGFQNVILDLSPTIIRYTVRCKVTDSFGNVATSNPCTVEFQIT